MEVPDSVPQWLVNLSVVLGFIITAIGGLIIQRREKKTERPAAAQAVSVVGGSLADGRLLERLCDQLGHNERAMRDTERAVISNTNEVTRVTEHLGEVRHLLTARNDHFESEAARMLAAIEKARTTKS